MGKSKIRSKDLKEINIISDRAISLALEIASRNLKYSNKKEKLNQLKMISDNPSKFINHRFFGRLAGELKPKVSDVPKEQLGLRKKSNAFNIWGRKLIADSAIHQMELAMKLPVAERGALMPDAHHGYGLPIGGVLATRNAVIPYAVGLDIGCRMSLTLYNVSERYFDKHGYQFKLAIKERTCFGSGGELKIPQRHAILERDEFNQSKLLKSLHGKAAKQLGTSGSGNHFVEFGIVELQEDNDVNVLAGIYVGLLAHSGSRGFGSSIAKYFTDVAIDECRLPRQVQAMAWLDMNKVSGQEYFMAMNLAGDYAKACHDQIHKNVAKYLGLKPIMKIENHHNFAWKEKIDNEDFIVHRKGATPAAKGELGIIPGSMASPAFIVKGVGNSAALNSASHGAGRKWSRKKAKESYTGSAMREVLKRENVKLIGGGIDEAPVAYKDINEVMRYQEDLVDVIGKFQPRIVRMNHSAKK